MDIERDEKIEAQFDSEKDNDDKQNLKGYTYPDNERYEYKK